MSRRINKSDPFLLDRLLSGRDQPAPAERDQIFAQAVAQSQAKVASPPRAVWFRRLSVASGAAALGVLAFWLVLKPAEQGEGFAHRGAGVTSARLSLSCSDTPEPSRCHGGDKLMFQVTAPQQQPYFAAFARRADDTVIWYFPSQDGDQSVDVLTHSEGSVLQRGIRLGSEHSAGRYEVTAIFSAGPLTQSLIKRAVASGELVAPEYTVVQRHFVVEEATP